MATFVAYVFLLIACGFQGNSGFLLDNLVHTITSHIPHKVCYGDLGCFSNGSPFLSIHRPLSVAPESPSAISTRFLLYTRTNPTVDVEEILVEDDAQTITSSNYNGTLPTKIIIHGFTHNAHRPWVTTMVQELLKYDDYNVIAVDWQKGASFPYEQATANTRVAGAVTAAMIKLLMDTTGQTADMFHIIGHSLGAHTAGYAGERISGIAQITGLDPAAPYFENTDVSVRLDPSDATFVDAIHTDDGGLHNIGFGMTNPCGHIDFFPNGGGQQPGCPTDAVSKLGLTTWTALKSQLDYYAAEETLACSHERSYHYYTESINHPSCRFASFPCASQSEFELGHCIKCPTSGCPSMGFHVKDHPAQGRMYLKTSDTPTYCAHTYVMNITASNDFDGILTVKLTGTSGSSKVVQLMDHNEPHQANSIISKMFQLREDVGNVTSATLHYEKTSTLIISSAYPDDWQLVGIALFNADTQNRQTFCAYHKELDNHDSTIFKVRGMC